MMSKVSILLPPLSKSGGKRSKSAGGKIAPSEKKKRVSSMGDWCVKPEKGRAQKGTSGVLKAGPKQGKKKETVFSTHSPAGEERHGGEEERSGSMEGCRTEITFPKEKNRAGGLKSQAAIGTRQKSGRAGPGK